MGIHITDVSDTRPGKTCIGEIMKLAEVINMKQYRIWIMVESPSDATVALNRLSREGWRVVTAVENRVILERECTLQEIEQACTYLPSPHEPSLSEQLQSELEPLPDNGLPKHTSIIVG